MLLKLLSGDFSCNSKLFVRLKPSDFILDIVIGVVCVDFSTDPDWLSKLFEFSDNIFCYFELKLGNIIVLYVFDGTLDKVSIHTFREHGAGLKDEPHLLFG